MNKLLNDVKYYTLGQSGETIVEILVAMLIMITGTVMFVSMLTSASNAVKKSDKNYQYYCNVKNAVATNTKQGTSGQEDYVDIVKSSSSISVTFSGSGTSGLNNVSGTGNAKSIKYGSGINQIETFIIENTNMSLPVSGS